MPSVTKSHNYRDAVLINKSDTDTFASAGGGKFDALYIGGAGNVAIRTMSGKTVTFTAVPVGTILPVQCDRVMSTNTTATLIIGLRF